ncbi:MAG: SPFH domain-containing protein, partial [Myxococcota bacterium]
MSAKTSSANAKGPKLWLRLLLGIFLLFAGGYGLFWNWTLSRIYVGPGQMMILTAKVGRDNPNPRWYQVVEPGIKGIQAQPVGEGRHFFSPIFYKRKLIRNILEIGPEEIGVVVSRSGKPLPDDRILADAGYKGIQRHPLTPGKWRINPYAYTVQKVQATRIRPGYVGCVIALEKDPETGRKGIMKKVLQPGLYYINPRAYRIEEVEIGYRNITLENIKFKSIDSFDIELDVSVVWGLQPQNVHHIIRTLGNINEIIDKIISPQVNTIVRLEGSRHRARQFIEGKTRELFQKRVTERLKSVCNQKKIEILIGLVRNITIPHEVRDPINQSKIAVEERMTKVEMRQTQIIKNKLEELKADVQKGIREVHAGTVKIIAEVKADGQRQVQKIRGETEVAIAQINRKTAEIQAQIKWLKGRAQAQVIEMLKRAKADEFVQFTQALGSGKALAHYTFTRNLRKNLRIQLRYAGPGTFWTDLKNTTTLQKA